MPRYAASTFLNGKQQKKLEEAVRILGMSKYRVVQDAVVTYSEAVIKEKKNIERERIRRLEERSKGDSQDGNGDSDSGQVETSKPPFVTA